MSSINSATYGDDLEGAPSKICPHSAKCPGCPLIETPYPEQLSHKQDRIRVVVGGHPSLASVEVCPIVPASLTVGYRPRLKWVHDEGRLGLFEATTHRVVDTPRCVVGDPVIVEAGQRCRELLRDPRFVELARSVSAIDLRSTEGNSSGRILCTLVVTDPDLPKAKVEAFGRELALRMDLAAFAVSLRAPRSPQILGGAPAIVLGGPVLDRIGSVVTVALPGSFVQAHREQAARLEELVLARATALSSELGRPLRVLELFAGAGAFGLALAKEGHDVTAVESFAPAATSITEAARSLGVTIDIRAEDADDAARALARNPGSFDLVVVDPPRRGLPVSLRENLSRLAPRTMVYVSCHPESLARDLSHLARRGLAVRRIVPVDMMPHTSHVEAVAYLDPLSVSPPTVLEQDATFALFDRAAFEEPRELEARARRPLGPDFADARPLARLPRESSGSMVLARAGAVGASDLVRLEVLVLAKGIVHKRGSLRSPSSRAITYRRQRVVGGHSLVLVECGVDLTLQEGFARIGHPLLGDARRTDAGTIRHFFDKHGLDRTFLHVLATHVVSRGKKRAFATPLAPDLRAVLDSLETTSAHAASE